MLYNGYNLNIVGYDGFPIDSNVSPLVDLLYKYYMDRSRPFGHELVLFTMLSLDDSTQYPWNVYYRDHPYLYQDVI
jgi:hypothetical protein